MQACVFRGIKITDFYRRRGLLTGLANAVVVVLQPVDGEGCSPVRELIKERVTPERLSNEFWPTWFDGRLIKIVLCWQSKGFSWP